MNELELLAALDARAQEARKKWRASAQAWDLAKATAAKAKDQRDIDWMRYEELANTYSTIRAGLKDRLYTEHVHAEKKENNQ